MLLVQPAIDECQPRSATPVSIIVPCHNEADSLENLATGLVRLRAALCGRYEVEYLLVDDGSRDATWSRMKEVFGGWKDVRLLRHELNRGIAAAIQTGLREGKSEIAASLDADCTYDPLQLEAMLQRMDYGVDMVVASPYHPRGRVEGVPRWRLALSYLASRLYRLVLCNKLHTYTSCVRVYRRSAVVDLPAEHGGFVGIVELLWQLDRRGGAIIESPALLTVRRHGQSKMRIAREIAGHLRLLATAAWARLLRRTPPPIRGHPLRALPLQDSHLERRELVS